MKLVLLLALLAVGESDGSSVVGQTGQSVTLSCKYDITYYEALHVCWGRGELPLSGCSNPLVSTDGHKVRTRASSRYQLLGRLEAGDVSLTILDLTETDAGRYGCRVEIPGWFNDDKHHLDLIVERGETLFKGHKRFLKFVQLEKGNLTDGMLKLQRSMNSDLNSVQQVEFITAKSAVGEVYFEFESCLHQESGST
ncbi:hepatitis A virus cellular receptor 1 homolog [Micropterus dolomieu]|uniref:hepatitis A virus cellular receptor 1 homolog n=1 Tax=Micropterus dolomieu TaxID=147949 RepID=UPI001E8E3528|nr:hepatitis A virus cellular receptor 1 homolog [Micropterus dolomieu]